MVILAFAICRLLYTDTTKSNPIQVSTWDALGYYIYLPAHFLYKENKQYLWFDRLDKKYGLSGGVFYQVQLHTNGNKVCKYLGGVAILQAPFYFIADYYVQNINTNYPRDGFSAPYQYAIAWGAITYCAIALLLLRTVLRKFFSDKVTAWAILMLLATNAIQYISVDSGQSHAYIFPLYVLILYLTLKWHKEASILVSLFIGLIVGLAAICRPTEAIMILIPILWNAHSKQVWIEKWKLIHTKPNLIIAAILGGFIGILPQLVYWKNVTGSWVYDVGSKWDFLSPHFRVLFGGEKGWFIYTPITILFVIGFWFLKVKPFRWSVIVFCLCNIYIIIAWHDWRYGGSFSTRALMQSYPIFLLAFAAFSEWIFQKRNLRFVMLIIGFYCLMLNLFQIYQYNAGILKFDGMNFEKYREIYLNPNARPQ